MRIISKSEKETEEIGQNLAATLKKGDIILLSGDLGFGKTTFTKGIARGLGIKDRIISPTFTIIRLHGKLCHIDLYRIENLSEVENLGFYEILHNDYIKVIEWSEKLKGKIPKKRIEVKILMNKDNTRTIEIEKFT